MRNSTAYVIAGLITLTSLPMYWAIYKRSHPDVSSSGELSANPVVMDLHPSSNFTRYVARYVYTLRPDERCIASMVVNVKGNVYTPLKEQGIIIPCHARQRDRPYVEYDRVPLYPNAGNS